MDVYLDVFQFKVCEHDVIKSRFKENKSLGGCTSESFSLYKKVTVKVGHVSVVAIISTFIR